MNLDDRHVIAAGKALRELKNAGDIYDAQVSIAVMCTYLCSQNGFHSEVLTEALLKNINELGNNPILCNSVIEKTHNVLHDKIN